MLELLIFLFYLFLCYLFSLCFVFVFFFFVLSLAGALNRGGGFFSLALGFVHWEVRFGVFFCQSPVFCCFLSLLFVLTVSIAVFVPFVRCLGDVRGARSAAQLEISSSDGCTCSSGLLGAVGGEYKRDVGAEVGEGRADVRVMIYGHIR